MVYCKEDFVMENLNEISENEDVFVDCVYYILLCMFVN